MLREFSRGGLEGFRTQCYCCRGEPGDGLLLEEASETGIRKGDGAPSSSLEQGDV